VARAEGEAADVDPANVEATSADPTGVEPPPAPTPTGEQDVQPEAAKPRRPRPKYRAWADLMRRVFEMDVLVCSRCGGRMSVLATIDDPAAIQRILTHLGLSTEAGEALPPARASPVAEDL
jgi:hypothetical protein